MRKILNLDRLHERKQNVYLVQTKKHELQIMSKFLGVDELFGCGHTFNFDHEKQLINAIAQDGFLCPTCKSNSIYFKAISNNLLKDAKKRKKQSKMIETKYYYPKPTEVSDVLGEGSFGKVVSYVFKFAEKSYRNNSDPYRAFMRECIITKRVEGHPNIINLVAINGIERKFLMPCYTSTFIDYMDKFANRNDSFARINILNIYRSVKNAIQYIHSLRVCHCDIKGDNVLINVTNGLIENVILADFGVSLYFHDIGVESRVVRPYFGNVRYKSPDMLDIIVNRKEVLMGFDQVAAADKWAFGVTMFELVLDKAFIPRNIESTPYAIMYALYNMNGPIMTKDIYGRRFVDIANYFKSYGNNDREKKFIEEMEHIMSFEPEKRMWISQDPTYGINDKQLKRFRKIERKEMDTTLFWPDFYMLQIGSKLEYRKFPSVSSSSSHLSEISKFTENILAYKDVTIAFLKFVQEKLRQALNINKNNNNNTNDEKIKYNIESTIEQTIALCAHVLYDFQVLEITEHELDKEFVENRERDYTKCFIACYIAVLYYSINKDWQDLYIIKHVEEYIKPEKLDISSIKDFANNIIEFYDYDIIDINNDKNRLQHRTLEMMLSSLTSSRQIVYEKETDLTKANEKKRKLNEERE